VTDCPCPLCGEDDDCDCGVCVDCIIATAEKAVKSFIGALNDDDNKLTVTAEGAEATKEEIRAALQTRLNASGGGAIVSSVTPITVALAGEPAELKFSITVSHQSGSGPKTDGTPFEVTLAADVINAVT
jgi:aerobic-type carbon monoxide dehydrogenase small subunit (CoxS/CutS family)